MSTRMVVEHSGWKHGHAAHGKTPEYRAWVSMLTRCFNPRSQQYPNYGGRGITVCPEWRNSFESFLRDVGLRPSANLSLDRRDNNGHYEPGNVRWANSQQQARNRRTGLYRRKRAGCSSQLMGIYWHPRKRKWQAQAQFAGKKVYLGCFETELAAALAFDTAARLHFGEHTNRCNFPPEKPAVSDAASNAAPSDSLAVTA
jgi:hypothetical protein